MDRRLAGDLLELAALLGSAALFYFAGSVPLACLGLAVFFGLSWLRIDLGLLAVVVFVPYFMHPKTLIGHHAFAPSEWLLIAVIVAAVAVTITTSLGLTSDSAPGSPDTKNMEAIHAGLARHLLPRRPRWASLRVSPFLLPGGIFLLAAAVSTLTAAEVHLAARELLEVIVEPMALFVLLMLFTTSEDETSRTRSLLLMGMAIVITGLVPAVIAGGQIATHQHLVAVHGASYKRVPGPYSSADNLGLLLDRTIPMALALASAPLTYLFFSPAARERWRAWSSPLRWAMAVAFVVMGLALVVTFVLGAWLGTAIGVVAMLLVRFKPGWWVVVAVVVVLAAGTALGLGKAHTITAGKRIDIWRSSIRMLRDHPILGVGPDNFQHYYAPSHGVSPQAGSLSGRCQPGRGYMQPAAHDEPCISHPHDEILDFLLSTGIAGLLSFLWLQWAFWRTLWRQRGRLAFAPVLLGAGGAMLASLLHGAVDNVYFLIDLSMIMWLLFAVASLVAAVEASETKGQKIGSLVVER